jgi:hypothetical protein
VRNKWIRPLIVAAILFAVIVFIVIGCSMKHRAPAKLAAKPAGKSTQPTIAHKLRTKRSRANAHDSGKPCVIAPSVATQQHSSTAAQENALSDSTHALSEDNDAPLVRPKPSGPSVIRILITVETEKQPDPAFRLFQPPAQAGRRPPNSGWQHFRPQTGE